MARAYFYIVDQGPNRTIGFERRNYGMFGSEAAAYSQATQWARDQGKDGHDGQVFTRLGNGKYRARCSFARDIYSAEELNSEKPRSPAQDGVASVPAMPRLLAALAFALVLAAAPGASAEAAASGTVQICRQTGIVDVYTGKPIAIPSGATFVDNSTLKVSSAGDDASRIRIATIEASQIAANAKCTVARARISQDDMGAGARTGDGKRLAPSRVVGGDLAGWPGALYLYAIVASDFR